MALTTLAAVKDYIESNPLTPIPSGQDSKLQACIDRAASIIHSKSHWLFEASADSTFYYDALSAAELKPNDVRRADLSDDHVTLYLDNDPAWRGLCQITTVTNGDGVVVTAGQYVTIPRNATPWRALRLKTNADVAWTFNNDPEGAISVLGRQAYSLTAPADIQQACIRLAAYLWKQRSSGAELDRPMVSPDGILRLPPDLPADVEAILSNYRKLR